MPFWNSGKRNNADDYDSEGYYDSVPTAPTTPADKGGLSLGGTNIELKVVRPETFAEVSTIADYLLDGCTVFLNMEATDKDVARRLLDFLSGVAYANHGQMKRVAGATFIISPNTVDVSDADKTAE